MKKIIALMLILAIILSASACSAIGRSNNEDENDEDDEISDSKKDDDKNNGKDNEADDGHKNDSFVTIDDNDYFLYVADYELYIVRGENDPFRLTEKLYRDLDRTSEGFWEQGFFLSSLCNMTADDNLIIYPDYYEHDQIPNRYTLCIRDLSDPKKDPVVISENVVDNYSFDKDNNVVKYVKIDNSLWYYFIDTAENKMITSDLVDSYEVKYSETGKCCAYKCNDGFIYVAFADGTTSSVDCDDYGEESYHAEYVFDDGKVVYRNDRYLTVTLGGERTPEGSDRLSLYYGWDIDYCFAVHAAKAPITVVLATVADLYEANVYNDYIYIINDCELTKIDSPFDFERNYDIKLSDDGQTLFYSQALDSNNKALFEVDLSDVISISEKLVDVYKYKYELLFDNAPAEDSNEFYVYRPAVKKLLLMSTEKDIGLEFTFGTLTLYTEDGNIILSENSPGVTHSDGSLFGFSSTGDRVLYITDYIFDVEAGTISGGTLNTYVNGKSTKIAENVQVIFLDPAADFIY